MRKAKPAVSIVTIFLIVTSFFSSVTNASWNSTEEISYSDNSYYKDISLLKWTMCCYELSTRSSVHRFFKVYCHIPIVYAGQAPVIIEDVWSEPAGKVVDYRIVDNYSGNNSLMEVTIDGILCNETIKLFWIVSTLVETNNYHDLPEFIGITPKDQLPYSVLPWLASTEFLQADHPDIQAKAKQLQGAKSNVLAIAERIAKFTSEEIEYKTCGAQDALSTLQNGCAVCTGKATLAAALLRALDIPARVLMVYPTHFIIEYYAHTYGWIRLESTIGEHPFLSPSQACVVAYRAYPEDETSSNVINGQHPQKGIIAYWGASSPVLFTVCIRDGHYFGWHFTQYTLTSNPEKVAEALELTENVWDYYAAYLGRNLSGIKREYLQQAQEYQQAAASCFQGRDFDGYLENMLLAYKEYSELEALENKLRGIAVGSDIIGDESWITELLTFLDDCNSNLLIMDFGWITWSWSNTKFDQVATFIAEAKQREIPVWLMYRARTGPWDAYGYLPHQVHRDGTIDDRDLCFSHQDCRVWAIGWIHRLLEKYPTVDGLILYNPRVLGDCCFCQHCKDKFKADTGIMEEPESFSPGTIAYNAWMSWRTKVITAFMQEWQEELTASYPQLKTGAVLLPPQYSSPLSMGQELPALGAMLDIVCPFVVLDRVTNHLLARRICDATKNLVPSKVVADIKIYGPYTNTDTDIVDAIKSSLESKGDGFFLWCYDYLHPGLYDLEKIKNAYNGIYEAPSSPPPTSSPPTSLPPSTTPVAPPILSRNTVIYLGVIGGVLLVSTLMVLVIFFKQERWGKAPK